MSNMNGYNERERRMVINAVAGTAFTILKVIKHTRSMGWDTMYRTSIEAICQSADALVGDCGGQVEIINRLAEAIDNGARASAPKPMSIKTESIRTEVALTVDNDAPLIVSPGEIKNARNN